MNENTAKIRGLQNYCATAFLIHTQANSFQEHKDRFSRKVLKHIESRLNLNTLQWNLKYDQLMERYSLLTDETHCKDIILPITLNLVTPTKMPTKVFGKMGNLILKCAW